VKIVFILDWFLYYSVELVNMLAIEHDVVFITGNSDLEVSAEGKNTSLNEFMDKVLDKKVKWKTYRNRAKDMRDIWDILRLTQYIRKYKPDVIHIQDSVNWRIFLLALLNKNERLIVTIHDVQSHAGESNGWKDIFHRWLLKKANKIIVHGEFLKKQFQERFVDLMKNVYVIPHGVLSVYQKWDEPTVREVEGLVLFFGRISHYKGIDVLLKAWPIVSREISTSKLVIAGKGQDISPYLEMIGELKNVEVDNRFIPHDEVPNLFRRASLVVIPYIEASQSGVIALAYAFSKPVVVTEVGSLPEVVDEGETGFIVSPNNHEALAEAIVKILENPNLRKNMVKSIYVKAIGELSWENVARKTVAVYSDFSN